MQLRSWSLRFFAALVAAASVGCPPLEEAQHRPLQVTVAMQVFLPLEGALPIPGCEAAATDVHWTLTPLSGAGGESGEESFNIQPDSFDFIPGGFDDMEPPNPQSDRCIFRATAALEEDTTFQLNAHLDFLGSSWTGLCTFAPSPEPFEPCEFPDWVGFSADGATPGSPNCMVLETEFCDDIPDDFIGPFP